MHVLNSPSRVAGFYIGRNALNCQGRIWSRCIFIHTISSSCDLRDSEPVQEEIAICDLVMVDQAPCSNGSFWWQYLESNMKKNSLAGISSMVSFGSFDFKYFQWLLDNYRNNHVDSQLYIPPTVAGWSPCQYGHIGRLLVADGFPKVHTREVRLHFQRLVHQTTQGFTQQVHLVTQGIWKLGSQPLVRDKNHLELGIKGGKTSLVDAWSAHQKYALYLSYGILLDLARGVLGTGLGQSTSRIKALIRFDQDRVSKSGQI